MAVADGPGASLSRRNVFGLAAAAAAAAVTLGGCGSSTSRTTTVPEVDAADALVLDALLANANHAVAAYARAGSLLSGADAALAARIGVAEAAHVYALTGAIYRLRGRPTAPRQRYAFTAHDGPGALALAAGIEDVSIATGIDAMAKLSDLKARGIVVAIANSDAQHAVLIAQARGMAPISAAIVRGRV